MKSTLLFSFCFNLGLLFSQSWYQMDDYPGVARDDAVAFTIDSFSYVGTGLSPWWSVLGDFYKYNHQNGSWSPSAALPNGNERQYAAGFSIDGKGYVYGGIQGGNYLNDLWEYDPISDQWTQMSLPPFSGRSGSAIFVMNDKAYLIGGKNSSVSALAEVWEYDPSNDNWAQLIDFPEAIWRASACSNQTKGFVFGGIGLNGDYINSFYKFDPNSQTWSVPSAFPNPGRAYSQLIADSSHVYLLFGQDESSLFHNDLWIYDTLNDNWMNGPALPAIPRRGGVSFSYQGEIFYTCGLDSSQNRLVSTWKYLPVLSLDSKENQWTQCYPNPVRTLLHYKVPEKINIPTRIYDMNGKILFDSSTNGTIPVEFLENGMYWLTLEYNERIIRQKFVKE